jgi:predicted ATP-dependent serine protease
MAAPLPPRGGRASGLTDRRAERGALDQLVNAVRAGGSRVLVGRGEPGVGKSALLDYLASRAAGCQLVRAAGVESEMELAFAGLHQLLTPMLDRADRLQFSSATTWRRRTCAGRSMRA